MSVVTSIVACHTSATSVMGGGESTVTVVLIPVFINESIFVVRAKSILGGFFNIMAFWGDIFEWRDAMLVEIPSGIARDRSSSKPEEPRLS